MSFWKLNIAYPNVANGPPSADLAPLTQTSSYATDLKLLFKRTNLDCITNVATELSFRPFLDYICTSCVGIATKRMCFRT